MTTKSDDVVDSAAKKVAEDIPPTSVSDMQQRLARCTEELGAILTKYDCRIVPFLKPIESVGAGGTKALIEATFGVMPNPPAG